MSNLVNYLHAQTKTALARAKYEAAQREIQLAEINERCAEVTSQHQPLADMVGKQLTREELLGLVSYIQLGRRKQA